jgi:hypothetical protein
MVLILYACRTLELYRHDILHLDVKRCLSLLAQPKTFTRMEASQRSQYGNVNQTCGDDSLLTVLLRAMAMEALYNAPLLRPQNIRFTYMKHQPGRGAGDFSV